MKKLNYLLAVMFLAGLTFLSCNKVKELADVTFDATYNTDLNVVVPAEGRSVSFDTEATIDPASDPEVEQYLDNIVGINVQSMTATITSISKDVTLVTADLTVSNANHSTGWTMENLPLSVGASIPLNNENGQWDTINQILMEQQIFTVNLSGETDEGDVTFTLQLTITAQIIANPL